MDIDYRRYQRKHIPEEQWLECEGIGCELRGQISVVGLGGVFIQTRQAYPVGRALGVRIRHGGGWLETVCVVRSVGSGGIGVEFMPPREQLAPHLARIMNGAP